MKRSLFFLLIVFGLFFAGCNHKEDPSKDFESRDLFEKSVVLIKRTTANIEIAQDSIKVDSLLKLFEKQITDLNFSYPPETDLQLTEEDNDSLFGLLNNMQKIREQRLLDLHLQSLPSDSISQD